MILTFGVALIFMGTIMMMVYIFWNPRKAREMKKWIIGAFVVVVLFLVAAFIDGVFIRH